MKMKCDECGKEIEFNKCYINEQTGKITCTHCAVVIWFQENAEMIKRDRIKEERDEKLRGFWEKIKRNRILSGR